MPGRRWSEGLHQAIEAKEGLRVQRESVTLATITFQNYFRLYHKLAGMTGTAMTEQEEFFKIYGLDVISIPTHRPMIRDDESDLVFRSENAKFEALIDEIEEMTQAGRPVLVGTVSVEKSEVLSEMLKRRGVKHEVLNAKFHEKEAPIVAQAGRAGAVTIATNMAGRGTDIVLGGNPAGIASATLHQKGLNPAEVEPDVYEAALVEARAQVAVEHEQVVRAGGLHIIGTERHDARRIDNQLRGRAGRQGDPGSSRFYLSLEDTLMKRFANDRVRGLMERFGLDDDVAIESRMVSKTIENAQSRVEGYNFDIRKRVVEYDDVISKQRETIYAERDKVLHNEDLGETVLGFLEHEVEALADAHLPEADHEAWDFDGLAKAVTALGVRGDATSVDTLEEIGGREEIVAHLQEAVEAELKAREEEHGEETWALVERLVLLRTIDSLWVEHLTEIDDMRRGVGLRGYGGTDPLNEFKREAFTLYEELRGFIRRQVASTIFKVTVTRNQENPPHGAPGHVHENPPHGQPGHVHESGQSGGAAEDARRVAGEIGRQGTMPVAGTAAGGENGSSNGSGAAPGPAPAAAPLVRGLAGGTARPGSVREQLGDDPFQGQASASSGTVQGGPKVGRNDPCHCGSGLKYKKCHGR